MIEAYAWYALKMRMDQWVETRVMYPNEIFTPQATEAFLIVQDVGLDVLDSVIGYNCGSEYRGLFNVSVMTPLNSWDYSRQKGLACRVADHFEYGASYDYEGVSVKIFQRPRIIGNTSQDKGHNRLEVQVNWLAWA